MKKSILFSVATAMICMTASAQQGGPKGPRGMYRGERPDMEKVAEMRANAIANELSLDDATTAKFTDIYKAYQKDMQAVGEKYHPKKAPKADAERKAPTAPKAKTDKEVEDRILNGFKEQKERIEVQENYYKKFSTILNPKQIQKVYAKGGNKGKRGPKGMRGKGFGGKKGKNRGMRNGGTHMFRGNRPFGQGAPKASNPNASQQ